MTDDPQLYRLWSVTTLRQLMKRTGTGRAVSVRDLAYLSKVGKSSIAALANGSQQTIQADKAVRIAAALGVDVLVLWVPVERAGQAYADALTPAGSGAAA
ncbi:helix-turn-helix transcriptional regulator [Streptomyces carpaticus]|uniref:helix-turn-helix domain-containing protein n=1 Tax=Streptomyces carpaticus TaxID=285558 RepID=UPI0031F85BAD